MTTTPRIAGLEVAANPADHRAIACYFAVQHPKMMLQLVEPEGWEATLPCTVGMSLLDAPASDAQSEALMKQVDHLLVRILETVRIH